MDSLTAQLLVNIIKQEMVLPDAAVWIRDQNAVIPKDNGLYVVVGMVSAFPTANSTRMLDVTVGMTVEEHQISEVQMMENIQIDIFSSSNSALMRSWEIIAAMQSFYSQQQQEKNNFKIFRIPRSFLDTSSAEGGTILNRYTITVPCLTWYRKDTVITSPLGDYYDDFTQRVDDEQTIGTDTPLIEFEITPDTPPPFGNGE
jgi:hypothetical protein